MASCDEFSAYCLASGSSANAMLVCGGGSGLLVDAGLGVRALGAACVARGVSPSSLAGLLITHEHIDHVRGAIPFARKYNVPLISTAGTLDMLFAQERRDAPYRVLPANHEAGLGPFCVRAVPVTHDAMEPVGFRVAFGDVALAYATDTGTVTPELREACRGASLLAIESNYDQHKLRFGPYPDSLKARIGGRGGHLSNTAACDLLLAHTDEHGPVAAWFAHLSEVNNTPRMVLGYWKKRYRALGHKTSPAHVEVALRDKPSLVYRVRSRAVQLTLF